MEVGSSRDGATVGLSRDTLAAEDLRDPLAGLRERFAIPAGVVYLDGNSLGPLPRAVPERVGEVVATWGERLIAGWGGDSDGGWLELPRRIATKVAPLVGAGPDEVAVADSTSVDLYKLLAAALATLPRERRIVLTTEDEFPTDLYVAASAAERAGGRLVVAPAGELAARLETLAGCLGVLLLGHVRYRDGELLDMAEWTRRAHHADALALWDLSHSAGAVDVDLAGCGVDLAVGCGYKFLNGGPGAPAYLYVARRHQERLATPIPGWLGAAEPFAFAPRYRPAAGVDRFLCGTPPVLALAALDAALDVWDGIDPVAVRARSLRLGEVLIAAVEAMPGSERSGLELATPRDAARRGSQVSWRHPRASAIVADLAAKGIVADFRPPDVVRCGLGPLFLRRAELWDAAEELVAAALRAEG